MNDILTTKTSCRLCHSQNITSVLDLGPSPIADGYHYQDQKQTVANQLFPLSLALCSDCGATFIKEVIQPDVLYRDFIYRTSNSPGLVEHFSNYADRLVEKYDLSSNSLVVDVGSNDGILLKLISKKNVKVIGVDPALEVSCEANASGVRTIAEYLSPDVAQSIIEEFGQADIVTANNVMANVDDLDAFVESVKMLLKPGGSFVMESGYAVDTLRHYVFDNIYHEHVSYFAVKPLYAFFKRLGMSLNDVDHVATKGGSIRCHVRNEASEQPTAVIQSLMSEEERSGIFTTEFYGKFNDYLASIGENLKTTIDQLKSEGFQVVGYGASPSVSTVLYFFKIGQLFDCLLDDNKIKHNTLSPGYEIPVYPSKALYETKQKKAVVVLAWRFQSMIIEKHDQALDDGHCFVQILPEVKTIRRDVAVSAN